MAHSLQFAHFDVADVPYICVNCVHNSWVAQFSFICFYAQFRLISRLLICYWNRFPFHAQFDCHDSEVYLFEKWIFFLSTSACFAAHSTMVLSGSVKSLWRFDLPLLATLATAQKEWTSIQPSNACLFFVISYIFHSVKCVHWTREERTSCFLKLPSNGFRFIKSYVFVVNFWYFFPECYFKFIVYALNIVVNRNSWICYYFFSFH